MRHLLKSFFFHVSAYLSNHEHTHLNREGQFILFLPNKPAQFELLEETDDELFLTKTGNRQTDKQKAFLFFCDYYW